MKWILFLGQSCGIKFHRVMDHDSDASQVGTYIYMQRTGFFTGHTSPILSFGAISPDFDPLDNLSAATASFLRRLLVTRLASISSSGFFLSSGICRLPAQATRVGVMRLLEINFELVEAFMPLQLQIPDFNIRLFGPRYTYM